MKEDSYTFSFTDVEDNKDYQMVINEEEKFCFLQNERAVTSMLAKALSGKDKLEIYQASLTLDYKTSYIYKKVKGIGNCKLDVENINLVNYWRTKGDY